MVRTFILSAHFRAPEWIGIQRAYLDKFVDLDHHRMFAVEGIGDSKFASNEETFSYSGDHGDALDLLAREALKKAGPTDWLVFLDSDAVPIAPLSRILGTGSDFVAVQRLEHLGSQHPHPCFAAVRAKTYRDLAPSWKNGGHHWVDDSGRKVSDVGSGFIPSLREKSQSWLPLRKLSTRELHPIFFALYGTRELGPLIYHHGAGSKRKHTAIEIFWETKKPLYSWMKNLEYRFNSLISPRLWKLGISPISIGFSRPRKVAGAAFVKALKQDPYFWTALYPSRKNSLSYAVRRWCRVNGSPLQGEIRF